MTGLRATRGRQERHAGLSPASGWMRWAGLGEEVNRQPFLALLLAPALEHIVIKLFVSVDCAPTTCMGLDDLEEQDFPIPGN